MATTTIKATKNMFNAGLCFTKGKEYVINKQLHNEASLIDIKTTNDQGEPHNIGGWWRNFKIVGRTH